MYRLVKPYQSNKVYEAKSFMHGANKCYRELKNNVKCEIFSIININDNSIYDFIIKDKPNMILQEKNNGIEELLNDTKLNNTQFEKQSGGQSDDIIKLKMDIKLLEDRIKILESKIIN